MDSKMCKCGCNNSFDQEYIILSTFEAYLLKCNGIDHVDRAFRNFDCLRIFQDLNFSTAGILYSVQSGHNRIFICML